MSAIWKKGVANSIGVDLGKDDIYGLDGDTFKCFYGNPDGTTTDVTGFSEFVKDIANPATCKANGDTAQGSKDIPVDDVSGWEVGMVAKVSGKDIYFYIESIDTANNILTARKGISGDIADQDDITQVGNTGVYGASVTIDTTGIHFFVLSNPSIGLLNKSVKVEVVEHDDEDVMDKLEEIENKIGGLNGVDGVLLA